MVELGMLSNLAVKSLGPQSRMELDTLKRRFWPPHLKKKYRGIREATDQNDQK